MAERDEGFDPATLDDNFEQWQRQLSVEDAQLVQALLNQHMLSPSGDHAHSGAGATHPGVNDLLMNVRSLSSSVPHVAFTPRVAKSSNTVTPW